MLYFSHYIIDVDPIIDYECDVIEVKVKNDLLNSQCTRGGIYKKIAAGNVRPCWVDNENNQAIWWISHLNAWGIGDLNSLGTDIRGLTGRNDKIDDEIEFGLPNDSKYTWYFWNGKSFEKTNDLKFKCLCKKKYSCNYNLNTCNTCPDGHIWHNGACEGRYYVFTKNVGVISKKYVCFLFYVFAMIS